MPEALKRFEMLPGDVDADHVERHALGARPAQRRQPVADLLEADAEAARRAVDVVALGLRRLEERLRTA